MRAGFGRKRGGQSFEPWKTWPEVWHVSTMQAKAERRKFFSDSNSASKIVKYSPLLRVARRNFQRHKSGKRAGTHFWQLNPRGNFQEPLFKVEARNSKLFHTKVRMNEANLIAEDGLEVLLVRVAGDQRENLVLMLGIDPEKGATPRCKSPLVKVPRVKVQPQRR